MKENKTRKSDFYEAKAAGVSRNRLGDSFHMKLNEIGIRHNLSNERLRQIEKRALLLLQSSPDLIA